MLRLHTEAIIQQYEDLLTATETYVPPPVQPTCRNGTGGGALRRFEGPL